MSHPNKKETTMYVIKYTVSPLGRFVGYIKKDKKLYFFSGADKVSMFERGIRTAQDMFKATPQQVAIDREPMLVELFPVDQLSPKWYATWWRGCRKDGTPFRKGTHAHKKRELMKKPKVEVVEEGPKAEPIKFDFHIKKEVNGVLKVYGCVLLHEYNMQMEDPAPKDVLDCTPMEVSIND